MLLRRGLRYDAGRAWTNRHIDWVVRLPFDDLASRMVVGEYVNAVQQLDQRRKDLEATIEELLPGAPFAETAYRLRCFRGLATLSAVGLCCEIGDFTRFAKPAQLTAFIGSFPPNTRPTASAASDRSSRPDQVTHGNCWSKQRGITAVCRPPAPPSRAARQASIPA